MSIAFWCLIAGGLLPVAVGVITATLRGVPQTWLDMAACSWLVVRVLYTAMYLADLARIRPTLWALSVLISTAIFVVPV
jgi:uncharacterized MAPEG superfamily protein